MRVCVEDNVLEELLKLLKRDKILCKKPIERRTVNPLDSFAPEKREPVRYTWLKTIDKMGV